MHVVERLLENAIEDNKVLIQNQKMGDQTSIARDIDFTLYAEDEQRANLVKNFIVDNRYGKPTVKRTEYRGQVRWQLQVIVHAPATENVVHTLSAFMVCLAELYKLEYDGWGSTLQK